MVGRAVVLFLLGVQEFVLLDLSNGLHGTSWNGLTSATSTACRRRPFRTFRATTMVGSGLDALAALLCRHGELPLVYSNSGEATQVISCLLGASQPRSSGPLGLAPGRRPPESPRMHERSLPWSMYFR